MNKVKIELNNCYGIKNFSYEFDLGINDKSQGVYAIYAPNGYMKSSFARTMQDFIDNKDSQDIIFPNRKCKRDITGLSNENIFVIKPYEESYSSKQSSSLLVNEKLKKEYENTIKEINEKKKILLTKLSSLSGLTNRGDTIEREIIDIFGDEGDNFLQTIEKIQIPQNVSSELCEVKYKDIINGKTLKILQQNNFIEKINNYVSTYNNLIEKSPILCKTFNHQNANNISKSLGDTGFFSASHSVNLNISGSKQEYSSLETLKEKIEEEERKILKDNELKKSFAQIDKSLSNNETRLLRNILADKPFLIVELDNLEKFKKNIWLSYFHNATQEFEEFANIYVENQIKITDILTKASLEESSWHKVVKLFNKRFDVPFTLNIENQSDVILNENAPVISFTFKEGDEHKKIEHKTLLNVLSQGERRALYLLNILFEIEAIKQKNQDVLFILDDIADSFDYKNKYAIIEYIKELAENSKFRIIFLTHNFDFYRTVSGRFNIPREKRLFAIRTDKEVLLERELYQKDVFDYWKQELNKNIKYQIAFIPFVRNIAEYVGLDDEVSMLTDLLHIKNKTKKITFNQLFEIFNKIINKLPEIDSNNTSVFNVVMEQANNLLQNKAIDIQLEDKIILAIAIRLSAEEYIIKKLNNDDFVKGITKNQTRELFDQFKSNFPSNEAIEVLDKVNVMTPENIHLNSFMYEPIIDMSSQHLYQLYSQIKELE